MRLLLAVLLLPLGCRTPKDDTAVDSGGETASDTSGDTSGDTSADTDTDTDGDSDTDSDTDTDTGTPPPDADGDGSVDDVDCDDTNPAVHPGATETCNGIDDDCDSYVDDDDNSVTDQTSWFEDADADGFGKNSTGFDQCASPGEGYTSNPNDCRDDDATIYPGAEELCDGVDNDCDGALDNGWPSAVWYYDFDADGYGDDARTVDACYQPRDYAAVGGDCADLDGATNPGASEVCNGSDDDCDGTADDGLTFTAWYKDTDGDGYGDRALTVTTCEQPVGYVDNASDCDDADATRSPATLELCNSIDDNCDGFVDESGDVPYYHDTDGDGFGDPSTVVYPCNPPFGYVDVEGDCDDTQELVYPGSREVCNGVDDDCDGTIDDTCL
jgi:hypothetical protein